MFGCQLFNKLKNVWISAFLQIDECYQFSSKDPYDTNFLLNSVMLCYQLSFKEFFVQTSKLNNIWMSPPPPPFVQTE